ncbi:fimbrial protein [Enterobacter ludwigii]|uniref:fimbrial protein n=1 Tax=Enterobacter ludwigii TaxID=299767 RepID=UPI002FD33463
MKLINFKHFAFVLAGLYTVSIPVMADTAINFRGILVDALPCTLSSSSVVEVSFGDQIGIQKVSSGIYHEPVNLGALECENSGEGGLVTLKWTGTPADFDADYATVVTAEQSALGVKMYADGEPLTLDTPLKLNGVALPELEAVLVQADGVALDDGEFTALGTFKAEYQ